KGQTGMLELSSKDEWVVYSWRPDENPADPKVVGRHPTILRAVVLPAPPHGQRVEDIVNVLETSVKLPSRRGVDPGLWLEIPADWISPRPSSSKPAGKSAKPQSRRWSTGVMIGIFSLIGVLVVAAGGWSLGLFFGLESGKGQNAPKIPSRDVYEQLLRPLGIEMSEKDRADATLVRLKFREVYCQSWFIDRFFPGASATLGDKSPEELLTEIEDILTKLNDHSNRDEDLQSSSHPDSEFVWVNRDVIRKSLESYSEFTKVIKYLPRHATDDAKTSVTKAVNGVTMGIPSDVRDRVLKIPDSTAWGSVSLDTLSKCVVKPAQEFMNLGQLDYVECFTTYEWRPGEAFPWDQESDAECQQLVYLLLPQQQFPSDVREAAEEMRIKLCEEPWNVRGITEQDVERRPWFVGRCFVEFLSRKHFTAEEQKLISESQGFVFEHLRKLPISGWDTSGQDGYAGDWRQSWNEVRKRLEELAKSLGVDSGGSEVARVQEVVKVVKKWEQERREGGKKTSARQEKIGNLRKERAKLEERRQEILRQKQEIDASDPRDDELDKEESEVKEKIQKLDEQIRNESAQADANHFSIPEGKVGDFWRRLTGSQYFGDASEGLAESDKKEG
ncbi:MAG TPA: hypothetical protein PKI05_03675, partial [Thermogutta sp.]|nr:hypothetical protein [Thermogutta sp.]